MDKYLSIDSQPRSLGMFTWFVLLSQAIGLAIVVMVAAWMGSYQGGFAWTEDPAREFNYHPLFMVIGMVFLFGDAIMVYRIFRNERKIIIKILHMCLQASAIIFVGVGLRAVFDSHNLASTPIPNLYSLHSWLGLTTIILFGMQFIFGFTSYLFPKLSQNAREYYMPLHRYWGVVIFTMAIATALMGITEKALWSVTDYNKLVGQAILVNMLGLGLVAFGICVGYIVTNENYKRQPLPEEEALQLTEQ